MFAARAAFIAGSGISKGSALFSSSYLSLPTDATAFSFPGDFTLEAWVRPTSTGFYPVIFSTTTYYTATSQIRFYMDEYGSAPAVATSSGALITSSTGLTLNVWSHIAVVRNGSTITLYRNGTSDGTVSTSATITGDSPRIGNVEGAGGPYYWTGYISNLRVVKGNAVYTSAFTPPTTPLTAISGTQLLTCQSATSITDASPNNFSITNTGGTTASSLSPF